MRIPSAGRRRTSTRPLRYITALLGLAGLGFLAYRGSQARRRRWYRPRHGAGSRRPAPAPAARAARPARTPPAASTVPGPQDVYHHFVAGLELLDGGHPAQAAIRLEKARRGAPEKTSVREALGRAYFAVGRWDDAEEEFRAVVELAPTNVYAHYGLARCLHMQGRPQDAKAHLKLARAMRSGEDPDYGSGLSVL